MSTINTMAAPLRRLTGFTRTRFRRGFSLIELAMVLAIITVMVAGVTLLYSNAAQSQKTNDTMTELTSVVSTIKTLTAGAADFTGISDQVVAKSGLLPHKWLLIQNGNQVNGLVDPFGGQVLIAPLSLVTNNDTILLEMVAISNAACLQLATADFGDFTALRKVDNHSPAGANLYNTPAFDPTTASGLCNTTGATASNNHIIEFFFH